MASSLFERRSLRRIPELRSLSSSQLSAVQGRMVYRSYPAGDVIWRTRGPAGFSGYLQSGEIDLEYRVDGILVRRTRLYPGDLLPTRSLKERRPHATLIARAVTDVRLAVVPQARQAGRPAAAERPSHLAGQVSGGGMWKLIWPLMLLMLIAGLAWSDLTRIVSGLFYLASNAGELTLPNEASSMGLLKLAGWADPQAAFPYNEQGYLWFRQSRLAEAEAAFLQALEKDPASATALNNLAITSFVRGDASQAAGYLDRALEQDPDNAIARYNLGIALLQLNDSAGALRQFREAGFIEPQAAAPLLQQAYLYNQAGEYAAAEQRARSALALNPSLAPAHLLLSISLYNQGRESEALASIANTLAYDPGNRVAAFYQGLILGHVKQYDAALPILQELLTTSTGAAETARLLMEIDALYRFRSESEAAGR